MRPGLVGWLKTLAREVGPEGDDRQLRRARPDRHSSGSQRSIRKGRARPISPQIPVGRWGVPRELGDVVCFLASERAAYITGTTIGVDGGLTRGLL